MRWAKKYSMQVLMIVSPAGFQIVVILDRIVLVLVTVAYVQIS